MTTGSSLRFGGSGRVSAIKGGAADRPQPNEWSLNMQPENPVTKSWAALCGSETGNSSRSRRRSAIRKPERFRLLQKYLTAKSLGPATIG